MYNYKDKLCGMCSISFTPTSPNQKYCVGCRDKASKIRNKEYDKNRNRSKFGYKEFTRNCLLCGKAFTTYYSKKVYCGSDECEKNRIRIKNHNFNLKRNKFKENERKIKYYYDTKQNRLLQKAEKYRELTGTDRVYTNRIYKRSYKFVSDYVFKHGYKLLTSKEDYKNTHSKIVLLCPEGHEWETTFHSFRDVGGNSGNRCLQCYLGNNYTSQPEQKLLDYFINNHPDVGVIHNDRSQIHPLEIDLYFPEYKVGVEVCGLYWHSEISGGKERKYHYNKMVKCYEKGIRLITVFEDEIRDKFDIVISRVLMAIGLITHLIYARKCELKEISVDVSNSFFIENHIHGPSTSKKAWGLFYEDDLVSAANIGFIGRNHYGTNRVIHINRFCSKINTLVIDGFSKLFKEVKKYCNTNNCNIIKAYCDMRYTDIFNPVYQSFGFKLYRFTKYTHHYIKSGKRYKNISLRKTAEEYLTDLTEWELLKSQGYDRVWDCGHRTYVYSV